MCKQSICLSGSMPECVCVRAYIRRVVPLSLRSQEVAASFHAAMRPEEYLANNAQLWDELHDMLAPQAPAPLRRLPYPFRASMLALLSAELPHLVAPSYRAATGDGSALIAEGPGSNGAVARGGSPLLASLRSGWSAEALEALVMREAMAVVGSEDLNADAVLIESGLDSLALIELVERLRQASGAQVERARGYAHCARMKCSL